MAALADLPSLDGRSCPERPHTFVQLRCGPAHEIASRRSIRVAISSRARAGSGMSGTEPMSLESREPAASRGSKRADGREIASFYNIRST